MDLDKGHLLVYYQCGHKIDTALDEALGELLAKYGYERWASGCDLTNGVRDLAFCTDVPAFGRQLAHEAMDALRLAGREAMQRVGK